MTMLLYDYYELEERAARHLRAWKVWHLILYVLAAIFGILNYIALQSTMQLVHDNCVLYPRVLEFKTILRPNETVTISFNDTTTSQDEVTPNPMDTAPKETIAQNSVPTANTTEKTVTKRETSDNETMTNFDETMVEERNVTLVTGNYSHQLVLDTERTLFGTDSECQFAEYMPVMSTICALVWITLFTMCPGGGRARTGLQQPWRILTPALLFAIVLAGLTGHSFSRTNSGLQAFCAEFLNVTNSTTCSSVDVLLERSWSTRWGFGVRAAGTRACAAAAWAAWTCAGALLLARCLAAPDFVVKKTTVTLVRDPQGKLTPHLRKSGRRRLQPSPETSPRKQDNASIASEPTCTTELATAVVEPGQDSAPSSLIVTPVRKDRPADLIEMTYTPQERRQF